MRLRPRLGLIFAITYLAIFLIAEFTLFHALILNTANSQLSGVPATFVTLPWSMMFGSLWDLMGFVKWYERLASTPALYDFFASPTVLPGAIINAVILYYVGRLIDHVVTRPSGR